MATLFDKALQIAKEKYPHEINHLRNTPTILCSILTMEKSARVAILAPFLFVSLILQH